MVGKGGGASGVVVVVVGLERRKLRTFWRFSIAKFRLATYIGVSLNLVELRSGARDDFL